MSFQGRAVQEETTSRMVGEEDALIDVYCVPRDSLLSAPATDGCGYRGKVEASIQTVENKTAGAFIPNYVNQYTVYKNDADLTCPDCGHELTPEMGGSARTERRRNLRKPDAANQPA